MGEASVQPCVTGLIPMAHVANVQRAIDFYKRTAPDCPEEYLEIWKATVQKLQGLKGKYGPFIAPGAYKEG